MLIMNQPNIDQIKQMRTFLELWKKMFQVEPAEGNAETKRVSTQKGEAGEAAADLNEKLEMASDYYQRFAESILGDPSAEDEHDLYFEIPRRFFEEHMKSVGMDHNRWESWVEVMRQRPDFASDLGRTISELQQAVSRHMVDFAKVSRSANEEFFAEKQSETVSVAFRRWMDTFDKHYQGYIRDPDYPASFANVVNGIAAFNQQTKVLLKPWCDLNGLPDPEHWLECQARMENLELENKQLRQELETLRASMKGDKVS